jgi:hypothetical protein
MQDTMDIQGLCLRHLKSYLSKPYPYISNLSLCTSTRTICYLDLFGNLWQYRGELNGNYMLRNSNEFNVPRFRISLVERLPLCSFPKKWNEFRNADAVKNAINKNLFKSKLKKCLLERIEITCNRLLCPF